MQGLLGKLLSFHIKHIMWYFAIIKKKSPGKLVKNVEKVLRKRQGAENTPRSTSKDLRTRLKLRVLREYDATR